MYFFYQKKHPSISARVPQIPFLYSYFKSVLEFEHNIILCFHNHFLHKTAPNPGIELAGYAVLLLQSANEPFEQFALSLLAFYLLCDVIILSFCLFISCCKFGIAFSYSSWSNATRLFSAMAICICSEMMLSSAMLSCKSLSSESVSQTISFITLVLARIASSSTLGLLCYWLCCISINLP